MKKDVEYLHIDYSRKYVTAAQRNVIVYLMLDSSRKLSDLVPWMLFARLSQCVKSTTFLNIVSILIPPLCFSLL